MLFRGEKIVDPEIIVGSTGAKAAAIAASAAAAGAVFPAGGTGAAAGAWDTAANRDAAISSYATTRTLVLELQTKLNSALAALRGAGIIVP